MSARQSFIKSSTSFPATGGRLGAFLGRLLSPACRPFVCRRPPQIFIMVPVLAGQRRSRSISLLREGRSIDRGPARRYMKRQATAHSRVLPQPCAMGVKCICGHCPHAAAESYWRQWTRTWLADLFKKSRINNTLSAISASTISARRPTRGRISEDEARWPIPSRPRRWCARSPARRR